MPPPLPFEVLTRELRKTVGLDVEDRGKHLWVTRQRALPRRGIFRILIPRAGVKVSQRDGGPRSRVRPDGIAWTVLVVIVGALLVEWRMDRVRYPREYPAAFVYGLGGVFLALLIAEVLRTRRVVRDVLARIAAMKAFD